MPSGRVHALMTTLAAGGLMWVAVSAGQPPAVSFGLAGGCLAGLLITPDLDVDEPVRSHYLVRRRAGAIPALLWQAIWTPYARLLPHRHWLSHAPVVSTLLRAAYLAAILWPVLSLLAGSWWPWATLPGWSGWVLIGLAVSDALHWAADLAVSRLKRLARVLW
jgi:uncharacterized metal-binding protein